MPENLGVAWATFLAASLLLWWQEGRFQKGQDPGIPALFLFGLLAGLVLYNVWRAL